MNNIENSPLVSIIIPCYNQGRYINDAVNSALNSTYENFEIIIVNDGSTDDSKDIIDALINDKITIIHQENQGVVAARNNAIKACKGTYVLPLDADDKIHQEYIEKAVKIFLENPDIDIVSAYVKIFGSEDNFLIPEEFSVNSFLVNNSWHNSTFFKKSDWEKVHGYKNEMALGWEDYEFWISLIEIGAKPHIIKEILSYYRKTNSQFSRTANLCNNKKNDFELYKKIIKLHPNLYIDNTEYIIFPFLFKFMDYIPWKMKLYGFKKILRENFFSKNTPQYIKKAIEHYYDKVKNILINNVNSSHSETSSE